VARRSIEKDLPHWMKEPTKGQRPINARSETAAKSAVTTTLHCARDVSYELRVVEGGKQPALLPARTDGPSIGALARRRRGPQSTGLGGFRSWEADVMLLLECRTVMLSG
jgi:hypothetical protein